MYLMAVTFSIISLAMSVHCEVIMVVSGYGQDTYKLKVRFSTQQFDKFSSCLTDGKNTNCTVKYNLQYLPQPVVTFTQATGSWPHPNSKCKFYKCKSEPSNAAVVCTQLTPLPVFSLGNPNYQVLNLANISSGMEACVTFIWDFISESLNYSNQFSGSQKCCSVCFSSSTTITITTTTTPPPAVITTTTTSSSSSAAAAATTTTTTTEVITKLSATTHVQMYENNSQVLGLSSEAPQHYDHNTDNMSPVIAAVITVVIIATIILIIVAFVFWRRRKQMSHTSKTLHNYANVSDYRETRSDLQPENECASGTRGDNLMKHVVREAKPMRNRYIDSQVISTTQGEMGQINIGGVSMTSGGGAAHLLPEIWTAKSAKAASVDEENTSKESKEYVNNLNEMTNIINDYTCHTKSSETTRNGKVKSYDSCYDLNDTDNEKTKSNSNIELEIPTEDNMSGSKITDDWIEASKNDYDYIDNDQRETKLKIVSDQDSDYSECRDVSCRASSDTSLLQGPSHLGTMYKKADNSLVQKGTDCCDVYDVCKIDSSSEGESRRFSDATVEDSYNASDGVISLINANYKSKNAYSRLGDHVRNITNPYDVLPDPHDDSSHGPCPFTSETQKREFIYSVAGSCVEVDEAGKPKSESTEKDTKMKKRKNTPTYSAVRKVKSGNIAHTKTVQRSEYTDFHSALSELSTEPKGTVEDITENAVKANETNIYSELEAN